MAGLHVYVMCYGHAPTPGSALCTYGLPEITLLCPEQESADHCIHVACKELSQIVGKCWCIAGFPNTTGNAGAYVSYCRCSTS